MTPVNRLVGSSLKLAATLIPERLVQRRFTILIFHRILAKFDPLLQEEPDANIFNWQMELLFHYFRPVSLAVALDELREGRLKPGTVCVTFDDGYADNVDIALPILQRWKIPATFFVATGFLDGGRMWNDTVIETVRRLEGEKVDLSQFGLGIEKIATTAQRHTLLRKLLPALKYLPPDERLSNIDKFSELAGDLPNNLMMTSRQVQKLAQAGMAIGAHTVSHPILARINQKAVQREIGESIDRLEELTGIRPRFFAYPNGKPGKDYTEQDREIVERLGIRAAVATHWGAAGRQSDLFQLPRFTPWDRDPAKFLIRLALNNLGAGPTMPG